MKNGGHYRVVSMDAMKSIWKIDLHVHSSEGSACAHNTYEEMADEALRIGLDGIAFTNHHHFVPKNKMAELVKKYEPSGLRIYSGIEVNIANEHFVVIGCRDERLEEHDGKYSKLTTIELMDIICGNDVFWFVAHPFVWHGGIQGRQNMPSIEWLEDDSFNIRHKAGWQRGLSRKTFLESYAGGHLSNSDAHAKKELGIFNGFSPSEFEELSRRWISTRRK